MCGFGIIVILTLILGLTALTSMHTLADLTVKMHDHPLAVSNAVRDIRANIFAMHRTMKDVASAKDDEQINVAMEYVNLHEQEVFKSFDIIFERFLGNKQDVQKAHKAFSDWKAIREEVRELMHQDKQDQAEAITKGKGNDHVDHMLNTIQVMSDFASAKEDEFFSDSQRIREHQIFLLNALITIIAISSVVVGVLISKSITVPLSKIIKEIKEVARGDFSRKVNIDSPKELGQLASEFNNMAAALNESTTSIKNLNEEITKREQLEQNLKASNKELERFAYIASHDLQEPLRMVSSYTQLLEKRYKDKLDQQASEFIHFAVDGAVRMQTLINDLLAYSRLGSKAKPFEAVDCNVIFDQVKAHLSVSINDSNTVITNDQLPTVNADPVQLSQIFQNLISNAIKFRGENPSRIHISAEKNNDHWLFSFRDNGIGIESKYKDKVFEIFQRLHSKEQYPGTGIGLAISKRIAERHGGKLWFDSEPGKGSIFYFTISQ